MEIEQLKLILETLQGVGHEAGNLAVLYLWLQFAGGVLTSLSSHANQPFGNPMTHCHDCNRPRFPEGGVQMTPKRWICARCWGLFLQGRQPVKEAA